MKKILKINIINLITLLYLELTYGLLVIGSFNHEQIFSIIIYSNIKMNKNNTSNKNDNIKEVFDYKDKK